MAHSIYLGGQKSEAWNDVIWVHTNSGVSQKSMMVIALRALFSLALFANIS